MTIYKDIPQPTDQRNVSQNDLLQNNRYLLNVSTTPSAPTGILSVDHRTSINNTANPTDGYHKQVSMLKLTGNPANMTNAVNSQNADGILYTIADTWAPNPHSVLKYISTAQSGAAAASIAYPLNIIQAFGKYTLPAGSGTATKVGNLFNLTNTPVVTVSGTGTQIDFVFSTAMSTGNYIVICPLDSPAILGSGFFYPNVVNPATGGFSVVIRASGATPYGTNKINVMVIGLF